MKQNTEKVIDGFLDIEQMLRDLINSGKEDRKGLLRDFILMLPPETERDYEVYLTRVAQKLPDAEFFLMELLGDVAEKHDEDSEKIAFACFFALNIYYRHFLDVSKLNNLVDIYENHFISHPMLPHLLSLFYKSLGRHENMRRSLNYARQAARLVENHAGIQHNLAETLINLIDEGDIESWDKDSAIKEAEDAIKKAIFYNPDYPKFYSTKAQLLAIKGDFEEAKALVNKAIDMEDSRSADYSIRLINYNYVRAKIQLMQFAKNVEDKLADAKEYIDKVRKDAEEQLNDYRVQSIELLGLFAALVSFVVSSVQFISRQSVEKGALLMLIFTGSLLCIYGGLSIILHGEKYLKRTLVVLAIAFLLIFLPMWRL